jgi:hypothetical protein
LCITPFIMSIRCIQKTSSNLKYFPHNIATHQSIC